MLKITEHGDTYVRPNERLIASICLEGHEGSVPFTSISADDGSGRSDTARLIAQPFPGQPLIIEYADDLVMSA